MKRILFITTLLILSFYAGIGQDTVRFALSMNHEISTDIGISSAWGSYGASNGFGLGFILYPDSKSSWYVKYNFSQSHRSRFFEAYLIPPEESETRIYSKNHLNFNSIVIGWKRRFTPRRQINGYYTMDFGYNLAAPSIVIVTNPRIDFAPFRIHYDHSFRSGLAIGASVRLKEYLNYYLETGITMYSKLKDVNGFKMPSSFLKVQTGLIVKL